MSVTRAPWLSTLMVSSTIIPSWEAAGQQALASFIFACLVRGRQDRAVQDARGVPVR